MEIILAASLACAIIVLSILSSHYNLRRVRGALWYMQAQQKRLCDWDTLRKLSSTLNVCWIEIEKHSFKYLPKYMNCTKLYIHM